MSYDHISYGESLARSIRVIGHSASNKKYFQAFGLEDLYEIDELISGLSGFILIAIDGKESEIKENRADALNRTTHYGFIVAGPTLSTDQPSISRTSDDCEAVIHQIIARLRLDLPDFSPDELSDDVFSVNGIGPIADNYYGVMLSFAVVTPFRPVINPDFWED